MFIPANFFLNILTIKYFSATTRIDSWKSNEMSDKNNENITKSEYNFAPTFVNDYILPDINFNGHYLINNIYIPSKVMNIYIFLTH